MSDTTLREKVARAIAPGGPTGDITDRVLAIVRGHLLAAAGREGGSYFAVIETAETPKSQSGPGLLFEWLTAQLAADAPVQSPDLPWWMRNLPDGWSITAVQVGSPERVRWIATAGPMDDPHQRVASTRDAALDAAVRAALEGKTE